MSTQIEVTVKAKIWWEKTAANDTEKMLRQQSQLKLDELAMGFNSPLKSILEVLQSIPES